MASASGVRAGRAFVEAGLNDAGLVAGLKSAEARVKAFGQSIAAIGARIAGLGTAITTPFLGAAKVFADSGSALNDMSARTGVSVEALSALGYAAQQSGTDMETVEGAVRKMQKALAAGSEENIQAEATFQALGLSVQQLMRLSPEQQFQAIAKSIGSLQNPTARAAAAMAVFGKSGTALLPMIADLGELTAQAKEFGLVWTGEEAKKADALGDSIDLLKASFSRILAVVGSAVAPMLTEVAVSLARGAKYAIDFVKANGPLIVSAFKIGVAITAAGSALVGLGVAVYGVGAVLGTVAAVISGVGTVLAAIVSPIGLVVAGLAGLAAWFVTSTDAGRQALTSLGAGFMSLKETAVQAFGGIADALKAGDIKLAGQILWAGLRVEWLKGTNYLTEVWLDWKTATIEVFRGLSFNIASLMTDAWATIQVAGINAGGVVKDAWTTSLAEIIKRSNNAARIISKSLAFIKNPFGDHTKEFSELDKQNVAANKAQDQVTNEAVAGGAKERAGQLGKVEQVRTAAQQALDDQQKAEIDARRKAAREGIAAAAAELKAAQDELGGLVGKAGKEAAGVKAPDLGKAPKFTPEGLDTAIQNTKAKVDVSGTFSGLAAGGLGAGQSVQDEQLKTQKQIAGGIEKLTKKVERKQAVFQ